MIRHASLLDATALSHCINIIFDEQTNEASISSQITSGHHVTLLAHRHNQLLGFADGFLTTTRSGILRFELDLVGVVAEARRDGVGRRLIQAMVDASLNTPAHEIRALVAVGNVPMQKALKHEKFTCTSEVCGLYTISPSRVNKNDAGLSEQTDTHIIEVQTLTYTGTWLEPPLDAGAIFATPQNRIPNTLIGAVIPVSDAASYRIVQSASFEQVGKYQWWTLSHNI